MSGYRATRDRPRPSPSPPQSSPPPSAATQANPLAGSPILQITSAALYLGAIPVAYHSPNLALGMICLVAVLWLMPPKKIVQQTRAFQSAKRPHSDPS